MTKAEQIRNKVGNVFNKISAKFPIGDGNLYLLKPSTTLNEFETIFTLSNNWLPPVYSEFRQNYLVEIAFISDELTEAILQATHIKVDTDIYSIRQADVKKPQGFDITWKIFAEKFDSKSAFKGIL